MSAPGIGNLQTLIKRLEAATSRLEDIAMSSSSVTNINIPAGSARHPGPPTAPSAPPAPPAPPVPSSSESGAVSPSVAAFNNLLDGPLADYIEQSKQQGDLVEEQCAHVARAFQEQAKFLNIVAHCKKVSTSDELMPELLKPTSLAMLATGDVKDKNRASKQFNMLSTVAEGIPALAWVTLESKPAPHVKDCREAAQFYSNRVTKDAKDKEDQSPIAWSKSFLDLLEELRKYVLEHHTTALAWNPRGQDAATFKSPASVPSAPPPPPAAPLAPSASSSVASTPKSGDMSAVFASLNKGDSVTTGLRKVDKSEMTHKNPSLRAEGVVSEVGAKKSPPAKSPKPAAISAKKPPKFQLEGQKWLVEYQEGNASCVIENTEINQIVNIFGCKSSVIQIKGKVNAISLVSCIKTSILFDSVVSSLSITSSPSFTVQVTGKCPTIMIDATDSGQIYLSSDSMDVEIVTAKTSAINVSLPVEGGDEGEFVEKAVPEQLKTVVQDGRLVTTVVEHAA